MKHEEHKTPKVEFPTVEEMKCPNCEEVTGHEIKNGAWTCVICGTPVGEEK